MVTPRRSRSALSTALPTYAEKAMKRAWLRYFRLVVNYLPDYDGFLLSYRRSYGVVSMLVISHD